jgi:hypothetical protein
LRACSIEGVETNLGLHRSIAAAPDFLRGGVDTRWLPQFLAARQQENRDEQYPARRGLDPRRQPVPLERDRSSTPRQILEIAPLLDRVGFRAIDYNSSTHMGIAVRNHREDPWERIRLTRELMPRTPLQFIGTGFRFISWETAHPEFMKLVYERLDRARYLALRRARSHARHGSGARVGAARSSARRPRGPSRR